MPLQNNNIKKKKLSLLLLMAALAVTAEKKKQLLLQAEKKTTIRRPRRWWVRPINRRKRLLGDYYNLYQEMRREDPDYFFNYTRMSVEMFDELLNLVKPHLTKKSNRPSISAECRLLITIRLLASGDCFQSVANSYRMGKSTVSKIFKETCDVLWTVLQPLYMPPVTEVDWKKNAEEFELKWNLPNCLGAIDGKHIAMKQPNNSGSTYYNYKQTFSIVLLGVCDASYKFVVVDIGAYGSQSDGGILKQSSFGQMLDNNDLNLPVDEPLPNSRAPFPYYFVGDAAFPLKPNLMKPMSGRFLSDDHRIYNYRISRARRCIENCFGILAARWRIFHKTIFAHPETVESIVKATTCLHNYIMTKQENLKEKRYCSEIFVDREINNTVHEGIWRQETSMDNALQPLNQRIGARNSRRNALQFREILINYVNNEGSVPWQTNVNTLQQ